MKLTYSHTVRACYLACISQGIVSTLAPLLFITFISNGWATLSSVTFLSTANFATQLLTDLVAPRFVDKIGCRRCVVAAHIFAAAGILGMATLPAILPNPFLGLLVSAVVYAVGGGLLEVLVNPVLEACPSDNKAAAMSLMHSFYCWGVVAVIILSTLWFAVFGRESWRILCFAWAVVPVANAVFFSKVPINSLTEEGGGMPLRELFKDGLFLIFMLLMIAAGSSEMAMAQWASAFAESGLHVSKAVGDIAGPCFFALLMGLSRAFYARFGEKINLRRFILFSGVLCLASYAVASFGGNPAVSLLGCAVCGFSVGIMWPGVCSLASHNIPRGGTALFAMLALGGDIGCTVGPTLVGMASSAAGDSLSAGLRAACVFPTAMIAGIIILGAALSKRKEKP